MLVTEQTVHRGRPRGFDAGRGVEIAAGLFAARGYDAVGVAELGRAIGISPPSFYAAYGSKAELLARVLEVYAETEGRLMAEVFAEGAPLAETVERLLVRSLEAYVSDPERRGCLVLEATRNSACPEAAALTAQVRGAILAQLRELIAARAEAGDQAEELAEYVLFALTGLSSMARDGASCSGLRTTVRIAGLGLSAALAA